MRENLRGLPIDSKYNKMTSVESSSCQYCSRSLPETSARLPAETNVDRPRPRRDTDSRIAVPSAPDWQKKPTRPWGGIDGDREALSCNSGAVLMMPRQLGPMRRR